jgi:hydroxypyruvate isomerase
MPAPQLSRRSALTAGTAGLAGAALVPRAAWADDGTTDATAGRLKQSVCRWCFKSMSLDELCGHAAAMGLVGIDLCGADEFETLARHGLVCTMTKSHGLSKGLCDPANHDACLSKLEASIEATAARGWRNVITFSGNVSDAIGPAAGLENCAKALEQIVPLAEKNGVTLCMELLNSKVDHPGYMCDTSAWGVKLVDRVGSDCFKLLYDIYHMQIMEGDVIRTIKQHKDAFAHYHTAGNPGRHELDETQELFYPAIARAIADAGFDGYLAHEFIPTADPLTGLREAVRSCTV